ncbi:prepilin peptidase [Alkaliphilus pronyensis]|uniref:Prepilin peptidase n=1 Tax=Alkaliphilus pronyensis TaxID=1482732 RepID=A0A6I0FDA6_9FIRM|nr:prepilin peptidase [Alkaliphilus pronyensis]KAB3537227.1 prepilin peptidase [Alkaliphilus pronyensis]
MYINFYSIKLIVLLLLILMASIADIKTYRISNKLIVSGIIMGALINLCEDSLFGLIEALTGILIPIIVLFLLFYLRMLGAGDIKLFSAIGAIMGSDFVVECLIWSFLSGGVLCFFIMILRKNSRARLKVLYNYIIACVTSLTLLPYEEGSSSHNARFPFAIAISLGSLISIFSNI